MKRFIAIFIAGMVLLTSCVTTPLEPAADTTIEIYHMNDTHSRITEGRYAGMGMAKMATLIPEGALLFDAGDTFHGQTIATLTEGASVASITNLLGVDVMVPGNHDFNYGYERLLELNDETDYPILSANIYKGGSTLFDEYIIIDIDGLKIAVFGLTTPETTYKTHPDNIAGLTFRDPIEVAKKLVPKLQKQAHIVIALTHLGVDEATEVTSAMVAEAVDGIDLIVDGHSHTVLENGMLVGDTLIVQAGEHDKNLGKVTLVYEAGIVTATAELISKENATDVIPDAEIEALIAEIEAEIEVITSEVIGSTDVNLDGERADVRAGETNLGNLITDAVLSETGADIVLTNGGGIRASIAAGDITVGDIITVLPFGNYVVTKELKGSEILAALEHGLSAAPSPEGFFPHIAGAVVVYDLYADAGSKVIEATINGNAIDPDMMYVLATNDFMAAGGDNYSMFADGEILGEFDGLDEIVINYIKEIGGDISPEVDGRLTPQIIAE